MEEAGKSIKIGDGALCSFEHTIQLGAGLLALSPAIRDEEVR
jgi:hypothetical protein